jgi:hypothetical protein
MKRSILAALLVLLTAAAARADGSIPDLRIRPGAGIGLVTVSVELNVEWRRFYGGAQLALAGAMRSSGLAAYSGLRGGVFLTDGPAAPFVGLGIGALGESDFDAASSRGLGASAEVGIALRRDELWFHPQFVLQAIVPFSQQTTSTYAYKASTVVLLGARIFL